MANIDLGKVAPTPKGEYDNTITYDKLDIVSYQGSSYIAKKSVPTGITIENTEYWQIIAKTPSLSIGTVTTVSSDIEASATITGTENNPKLNLKIPRGVTGNESIDDDAGEEGNDVVWSASKSARVKNILMRLMQEIPVYYNGGLNTINDDETADPTKLYVAMTNTVNNHRIMFHTGVEWQYFDTYKYNELRYLITIGILNKILYNGIEKYSGTIADINADETVDITKVYILSNNRITVYSSEWISLDNNIFDEGMQLFFENSHFTDIEINTDLNELFIAGVYRIRTTVIRTNTILNLPPGAPKNEGGLLKVERLNSNGDNTRMEYISYLGKKYSRYKYIISGIVYITDWISEDFDSELYTHIQSELVKGNQLHYNGALGTLRNDETADPTKIYIANVDSSNSNRIMYHNGTSWNYYETYKESDFINVQASDYAYNKYGLGLLDIARQKIFEYNRQKEYLNFAFITDTHAMGNHGVDLNRYCQDNLKLFQTVCNENWCRFAVHCGDLITSYNLDNAGAIKTIDDVIQKISPVSIPLYFSKGNHDVNAKYKTQVSEEEQQNPDWEHKNYYIQSTASGSSYGYLQVTESTWDGVSDLYVLDNDERLIDIHWNMLTKGFQKGAVYDGSNPIGGYYYSDYDDIRIIVLNVYDTNVFEELVMSDNQIRWLCETALNTSKEVIVFTHMYNTALRRILQAFVNGGVYSGGGYSMDFSQYLERHLIALIHGHIHASTYDNQYGFNIIGCREGFCTTSAIYTAYEFSFGIFTVDTDEKVLYETRVGLGEDRSFSYGDDPGQLS